jgi:hypothetical protein
LADEVILINFMWMKDWVLVHQSIRGFLERIRISAYFLGEDVDHVWISEKVNLDEGDHFLCNMVKEE